MATVNYVKHLNSFYACIEENIQLNGLEISLYLALFQLWNRRRFPERFSVYRPRVMRLSGIGSAKTYGKCLKRLAALGFITHYPPRGPGLESEITIHPLPCTTSDTAPRSENGTLPVADMPHLNKHINKLENREAPAHFFDDKKSVKNPGQPEVLVFFQEAGHTRGEALKFFHHYTANGWLQAGKTPIKNWQAAARKWMLNIYSPKSIPNERTAHLHTREHEDYSEPL